MWNQISCNKIVSRKSVEKENARLTESLRHTKSSLRSTTNYKSMSKSRTTLGQKNWELFKENKKLTSRIESIQRSRNSKSMDRLTTNTSILKLIQNNKRRITDLKQKSIQKANKVQNNIGQKLLQKIVSANSTLKTFRLKTTLDKSAQKAKPKPILFMSDQKPQSQLNSLPSIQKKEKKINAYPKYPNDKLKSSPKLSNKQNSRKVKTQALDISEVINVQQNDISKNKSQIQDDVVVEEWKYADDGLVEEILDAEQ